MDEHKKGKANFFLLDQFGDTATNTSVPAGTLPALSVIEVDSNYKSLAYHLLGNVFIAEDESALENSNGQIILEKTGKYLKGKYSIIGGSVGLFEGKKIGRAKNLEKLIEEIHTQEQVVAGIRQTIQEKHNEVIGYNEQLKEQAIKQTQQEINQLTNQVFALQNKVENLHALQSTSRNRLEELQQQLETSQQSISGTRSELTELLQLIEETGSRLVEIEQSYKTAEQEYNSANAVYNEFNLSLTRQQSRINSIKQELEFKRNQLNDLTNQIEINSSQLKQVSEDITASENLLNQAEEGLLDMMRKKEADEQVLNQADQAYYTIRNLLNEKEAALRTKVKEKEQLEHSLGAIKDRLNELKLQLAGMKERLQVEFRINLDDIIDQPRTSETPVEELQEKSERMKKRLENLGEVNPTAIEAFTEMKKRYEFILEQKNDLVSAKDSLLQTIAEVESTANQKFLDTFNQVKENFIKVFKALFTEEDQCDLILENPENLAETGIDIIAKPKGKRPSSITQLSGGEKTLTATALLFAIYLIKPAPFCILDEVDAPLDDANVGKFTNMIRRFSEESQFIIVTHNKMTMSAVDAIYGVTMQEPGVSKLVPVDFRNLN